MKFSIWIQPLHHPEENPTMKLEEDLQLIQNLDKLGFDSVFIGEHHSTGWEPIGSPEILLAAAAMTTKYIKLGTGIIPLAIHNPLHILERAILIDHLSRGRSILGIGVGGGLPSDLYVYGLNRETARTRFSTSYSVIKQLLENNEPVNIKTDWFEMHDTILQLKPYGSLPIMMATKDPEKLRELGRIGGYAMFGGKPESVQDVLALMQKGADEVGKTVLTDQLLFVQNLYLTDSKDQAILDIKSKIIRERTEFYEKVNGYNFPQKDHDAWFKSFIDNSIIGSPQDVIVKIQDIIDKSGGVGSLVFTVKDWADFNNIKESFELLARFVMPKFTGSSSNLVKASEIASKINAINSKS